MSEPRKSRESAPWPPALGVPGYRPSRPPGSTAVALPREGAKQRVTCPVARPGRPPPHAISDDHSTRCAVYGRVAPQNPCPGIVNANLSPTTMLSKSAHDSSSDAIGTILFCQQVDNGPHWGRTCTPICDMSRATAQIVLPISIQPAPKTIL